MMQRGNKLGIIVRIINMQLFVAVKLYVAIYFLHLPLELLPENTE
jgi:hypothetical protein